MGFLEKYPRIEKQTRGVQKRETFLKLKTLKTAVEQMFSPCVCAQNAVFSLVLNYENMKKQTTYNPAHTNPWRKYGFSTGFGTGLE